MTIRYGNDLTLSELLTQLDRQVHSLKADVRDGYLSAAAVKAIATQTKLDKFIARINEIQPMPKLPDGYK